MVIGEGTARSQAVVVGALLVVTCAFVASRSAAAKVPEPQRASFLVSASDADRMVPLALQPLLSEVRPVVATAMAGRTTVFSKAMTLERIVHTVLRGRHATCAGYSALMVALGRGLGLPVRITFGGSSASGYDSHTTVSVWLARFRSWAIVDPTFGGTFTRGHDRRPLNAVDLRDALVQGWWRKIRWHPSAPDSARLSRYYVNPLFLFRYVGAVADVDGGPRSVVLPDSALLVGSSYTVSANALATTAPSRLISARPLKSPIASGRVELPLPYAPEQAWRGSVKLPATIDVPRGSLVIWSSSDGVRVGRYATTPVDGGSLSPIFVSDGRVRLVGTGRATVRVFLARHDVS